MSTKELETWLSQVFVGTEPEGSGLGIFLRKKLRLIPFLHVLGVNLVGTVFAVGVVFPQATNVVSSLETIKKTGQTVVEVIPTETTFQWPLSSFGMSQYFSVYHPGLDLTAPHGTPIRPVAGGTVVWAKTLPFGYGQHVLVKHEDNTQSLYAHMSKISVHDGDKVTKETTLGAVGSTGWSTGEHLHLEVYDHEAPINPLEVLPEIKK